MAFLYNDTEASEKIITQAASSLQTRADCIGRRLQYGWGYRRCVSTSKIEATVRRVFKLESALHWRARSNRLRHSRIF